jgi:hypothetical protein
VTKAQKPAKTTAAVRVFDGASAGETILSIIYAPPRVICPDWVISPQKRLLQSL